MDLIFEARKELGRSHIYENYENTSILMQID